MHGLRIVGDSSGGTLSFYVNVDEGITLRGAGDMMVALCQSGNLIYDEIGSAVWIMFP